MKPLLTLLLACAFLVSAVQAQEAQDPTTETLQQKIAQQAQTITDLQARLTSCQGEDSTSTGNEATLSNRYNFQAPAAPRRTVGVYQQPAEPKLTCADYSAHYFSRHPAMAAVCGAGSRNQPAVPEDASAHASSTTPLPQHP